MKFLALILSGEHHAEGSAVLGRGEAASVAVSEDAGIVAKERCPMTADGVAHCSVFFMDRLRFGEQAAKDDARRFVSLRFRGALHASQRPEKIDRGGAAGSEVVVARFDRFEEGGVVKLDSTLEADDEAVGGGDANGGGASNSQTPDRLEDGFDIVAVEVDEFAGKARLIDHAQMAEFIALPGESLNRSD